MTAAGIVQSGYASSTASTGLHAADEGFVDVDLDLDRIHVDEGADAGAGEAADRERRDHFARLRAALDHDAVERRADAVLLERVGAAFGVELRGLELHLRLLELSAQHAGARLGLGQVRLARRVARDERLGAREDALGVVQVRGNRADRGLGGVGARARQREVAFGEHAVEPREHVALLDHHAFFDEHLDHLAGDLGGDGGLAARDHVAGGDERARARRFGRDRGRRGRGPLLRRRAGRRSLGAPLGGRVVSERAAGAEDRERGHDHRQAAAPRPRGRRGGALDP
jgi:hypothetical protein